MLKEPKENIALTCSDCGLEQYFKIKEMEKELEGFVYCMFEVDHEYKSINTERMWIQIEFGDQQNALWQVGQVSEVYCYLSHFS